MTLLPRLTVGLLAVVFSTTVALAAGSSLPPYTPPPLPLTQRAPSVADDSTAGYAVGNLWRYGGVVYQALQVTTGHATWSPVYAAQALPTDAVPTPLACYGNKALNASWLNGNWIDVSTSAGGTVTTIKFANGQPDVASLGRLIGGGLGYVSKVYDQCGAALDATQATAASQPVIRIDILTGGAPSIIFDSNIDGGGAGAKVAKYLVLPSGVTMTGNADSAFGVFRATSNRRQSVFFQFVNATYPQTYSAATAGFSGNSGGAGAVADFAYGGIIYPVAGASQTEAVIGFTSASGTGHNIFWNNANTAQGVEAANTLAGGYIGAAYSGATQNGAGFSELGALVIYARALSAADTLNLRASLTQLFAITPQAQDVIAVDGDSITQGYYGVALQNYSRKYAGVQTAPSARIYNTGYYGHLLCSNKIADYPNYVAHLYNPAARNNIVTIFAGTNDIAAGTTGAATYACLTQYNSLAHATGFKVIVATMLPRSLSAPQITEKNNYNALIAGNSGGSYGAAGQWDGLMDMASDPTLGAAAAYTNTTLYPDATHPSDLGIGYETSIFTNAVAALTH